MITLRTTAVGVAVVGIALAVAVAISLEAKSRGRADRGKQLATLHCSACHLEPSPDLLPARSWETALGYMGLWLGGLEFAAFSSPELTRGRWMSMDIGDLDGDDDIDVVLGGGYLSVGMLAYPDEFEELAARGPTVLILKNTLH